MQKFHRIQIGPPSVPLRWLSFSCLFVHSMGYLISLLRSIVCMKLLMYVRMFELFCSVLFRFASIIGIIFNFKLLNTLWSAEQTKLSIRNISKYAIAVNAEDWLGTEAERPHTSKFTELVAIEKKEKKETERALEELPLNHTFSQQCELRTTKFSTSFPKRNGLIFRIFLTSVLWENAELIWLNPKILPMWKFDLQLYI